MSLHARAAALSDADAITRIYNQGIADRTATFETRPRSSDEIGRWFDGRHPIVVVEEAGAVVAFAAASQWRARECYRGIAELAVYVAREHRGRGAGRLALDELARAAEGAGFWKLLAATFATNDASRALLRGAGFREIGVFEKQAVLEGRWIDVVLLERLLGAHVTQLRG